LADGHEVTAIVRSTGTAQLHGLDVRQVRAGLGDVKRLASALKGLEGLVHCADLPDVQAVQLRRPRGAHDGGHLVAVGQGRPHHLASQQTGGSRDRDLHRAPLKWLNP